MLQRGGGGFKVFLIARSRCQNGGISTSGSPNLMCQNGRLSTSGSPNLMISKTSRYSNPVEEYSRVRMCIMLGPHEAGVWAKHASLTIPAPSRYGDQQTPWLQLSARGAHPVSIDCWLEWPACGAHPCRSCMVAPRDYMYFQDDQSFYSRLTTHFISLALEINNVWKIHVGGKNKMAGQRPI